MLLALAAVGLSADLHRMRTTGPRPNLLGLGVWLLCLHRAGANLAKRLRRLENNGYVDKKTQTPEG